MQPLYIAVAAIFALQNIFLIDMSTVVRAVRVVSMLTKFAEQCLFVLTLFTMVAYGAVRTMLVMLYNAHTAYHAGISRRHERRVHAPCTRERACAADVLVRCACACVCVCVCMLACVLASGCVVFVRTCDRFCDRWWPSVRHALRVRWVLRAICSD